MKQVLLATIVLSVLSATTTLSYATDKIDLPMPAKTTVANEVITGKGQVVLISKDKSKVTFKHETIPAIQWPAMTMEFKVKSSAVLAKTKVVIK